MRMKLNNFESWKITKPVIKTSNGIVNSQHYRASQIGAKILAEGGNAIDAAIATSFAIGVLEPWQSGLGGVGHMLIKPKNSSCFSIDFAARTPSDLNIDDYQLTGENFKGMFGWPGVTEDRNIEGPFSMGVPGQVAGLALAHKEFGSLPWHKLVTPAINIAKEGLNVDWYLSIKIAAVAEGLNRFPYTRERLLRNGMVPVTDWSGLSPKLQQLELANTLQIIADYGGEDFYRGNLAQKIANDLNLVGSKISIDDLYKYEAEINEVKQQSYKDNIIYTSSELTAGPSLINALYLFKQKNNTSTGSMKIDASLMNDIALSLKKTYKDRIQENPDNNDIDAQKGTCTTHISVIDKNGNTVSLTQTLLSMFGSKVTLPNSGIVMNNALMWFDPTPGKKNSLRPCATPLSNMCPTIVTLKNGDTISTGASGGRRIMPAVMQILIYIIDCGMSIEEAIHAPRIDVSGEPWITVDSSFDKLIIQELKKIHDVNEVFNSCVPNLFGSPNIILFDKLNNTKTGGAFVYSPWAAAVAEI